MTTKNVTICDKCERQTTSDPGQVVTLAGGWRPMNHAIVLFGDGQLRHLCRMCTSGIFGEVTWPEDRLAAKR